MVSSKIRAAVDSLSKLQLNQSPPVLADIDPMDWDAGVSYSSLISLTGLNDTVTAKKFWKKDVLECLLGAQIDTAKTIDGKYDPAGFFGGIANDLENIMLWAGTKSISTAFTDLTMGKGDTVLKAAGAFVQKTIDMGGAPQAELDAFNAVTANLANAPAAQDLFNLCSTEMRDQSLVTFSVGIATHDGNIVKVSLYAFHYNSVVPIDNILEATNDTESPISLSALHGTVTLDESQYVYVRPDVHKSVSAIEGLFLKKV